MQESGTVATIKNYMKGRAEYLRPSDITKSKLLEDSILDNSQVAPLVGADAIFERGGIVVGYPGCGKTFFTLKECLKRDRKFVFYCLDKGSFQYKTKMTQGNPELEIFDDIHYWTYAGASGELDETAVTREVCGLLAARPETTKILISCEPISDSILRLRSDSNRRRLTDALKDFASYDDARILGKHGYQCKGHFKAILWLDSLPSRQSVSYHDWPNLCKSKGVKISIEGFFGRIEANARSIFNLNVPYFSAVETPFGLRCGPVASPRALALLEQRDKREFVITSAKKRGNVRAREKLEEMFWLFDNTSASEWPERILRLEEDYRGTIYEALEYTSRMIKGRYNRRAGRMGTSWGRVARELLAGGDTSKTWVDHYMRQEQ